jgi:drug/metabolite transporter (DMT)-like permease
MGKEKYFWVLHTLVFFSSAVPLIMISISLSSFEIVFLRTLMAILFLYIFIYLRKEEVKVPWKRLLYYLLSGIFTSAFWIILIYCAKMSNASVTLVGLATTPLWISFITPIISKERLSFHKVMIGLCALFGIYMIFNSGFHHHIGLLLAILCGLMSAVLNISNARFAKNNNNLKLALYQSVGALMGTVIFAVTSGNIGLLIEKPNLYDITMIAGITFLFSVLSYLMLLQIMKRISVFNVSLAFNLSPVYGSLLAFIISSRTEVMNVYFYGGAIIIVFSVFAYPLAKYIHSGQEEIVKNKMDRLG